MVEQGNPNVDHSVLGTGTVSTVLQLDQRPEKLEKNFFNLSAFDFEHLHFNRLSVNLDQRPEKWRESSLWSESVFRLWHRQILRDYCIYSWIGHTFFTNFSRRGMFAPNNISPNKISQIKKVKIGWLKSNLTSNLGRNLPTSIISSLSLSSNTDVAWLFVLTPLENCHLRHSILDVHCSATDIRWWWQQSLDHQLLVLSPILVHFAVDNVIPLGRIELKT